IPVLHSVSQAMRAFGSWRRISSTTASEIRSHILSGCPSETDSEVKKKFLSAIEVISPWKVRLPGSDRGNRGTVTGAPQEVQMQSVLAGSPVAEEKRRLRRELRLLRQALDASALERAARAVRAAAAGFGALPAARTVAGYVACDGEVDVGPLLDDARQRGAVILLPRRAQPLLELVVADPA